MSNFFTRHLSREAAPSPKAMEAPSVGGGNFEGKVEHAAGFNTSPTVSAWYRGVELRANAVSQLRIEYQHLNGEGGNYVMWKYGYANKLNYLLQVRPNYYENAAQMAKRKEIMRIMKGNAYIYIEKDRYGLPLQLHLCQYARYNETNDTYDITYSPRNISRSSVPSSDIIHLRNTFTDQGGMNGVATLTYAARTLNIAATNEQQALDTASKNGRFKMLLTQAKEKLSIGGKFSASQMEEKRERMQRDLLYGDIGVVPYGTEVKTISMSAADMQILESRKFGVAEIGRFLGLSSSLLGDVTNQNYKTAEHASLELYRTLAPLIHEEEAEWNSKLIGAEGFGRLRVHICEKPLFRLDLTSQAEWNKNRLETGCATVNELRAEQDMPTIEGGDELLLSANLKTLAQMKSEGMPTTETESFSEEEEEEEEVVETETSLEDKETETSQEEEVETEASQGDEKGDTE